MVLEVDSDIGTIYLRFWYDLGFIEPSLAPMSTLLANWSRFPVVGVGTVLCGKTVTMCCYILRNIAPVEVLFSGCCSSNVRCPGK